MPYTPSNDPVVQNAATAIFAGLDGNNNVAAGATAFQDLMADPNLTGRQKQAVCCEVGRAIVNQGVENARAEPKTLLRESNASTQFMTDYMSESAARFFDAVKGKAEDVGRNHQHTQPLNLHGHVQNHDAAVPDATRDLLNAFDSEKHKLSPDACEFMQACSSGIPGDIVGADRDSAEKRLAVNTLMLRGAINEISNDFGAIRGDNNASQSTRERAAMTCEASRSAMKFLTAQLDDFTEAINASPAAVALSQDDAFKQQMEQTSQQLGEADHATLQAGAHVGVGTTIKAALGRDNQSKLNDAEAKLQRREAKLADYLNRQRDNDQKRELKQDSLNNAANNPHVSDALKQKEVRDIQKLDQKGVRLDAKVQNQQQKVANSETRVDQLKTRIGRH